MLLECKMSVGVSNLCSVQIVIFCSTAECSVNVTDIDPKAYVFYDDHWYYFSVLSAGLSGDYMIAASICNDMGAALLSLETKQESDFVFGWIRDNFETTLRFWTSGMHVYDSWLWSGSGHVFSGELNWSPFEPTETDPVRQACVYLFNNGMHDTDCSTREFFYYICEERRCT